MRLRKNQDDAEIPTASMADIAFLLIVFFMLTAVFAETRGINFTISRPEEEEEKPEEQEEAVSIRIDGQGQVTIDKVFVPPDRLREELASYLAPKLERWPEKPILLTADEDAPYGTFVEIYDALRRIERDFLQKGVTSTKMKLSILSLTEINRLKEQFGEDIFE